MSRKPCGSGPVKPARPRSDDHRDKGIVTMKRLGIQRLAGLALAAMIVGVPFATLAQPAPAAPAPAAAALAATPAPEAAPPAAAPAPAAAAASHIDTVNTARIPDPA